MENYAVLSVGAGQEQIASIRTAKRLGLYVISCDANEKAEGAAFSDIFYPIDIKDENKVIAIAKEHHIRFILPSPLGRYLTTVGAVNDALKLKGIIKHSAQLCTDKYLFHQNLKAHIPLAQQFVVTSAKEVFRLLQYTLSVPFVLKPRFGSGSKGVQVFEEDNTRAIEDYFKYNTYGEILIEEFITGDEIGIDAVIHDGELELIAIRDKTVTPLPHRQEIAYSLPSKYSYLDSKIEALLKKIVSICEINNSLIHADAIISNEKIYIIELAPRASGNKITELLLPLALGEEPLTRFIEFLMGNNSLYKSSTPLKPTIFHFIDFPEEQENKIITQINPLNNIQTLLYYKSDLRVGDRLHKITNGSEAFSNGYFILQGDPKAMHQDIKTIQKRFKTTTSIDVINKTNQKAWSNIINKNTLLYPDTPIVSFLARHFSNRQENKHKTALDIGFGSGRHLQLLKDYQFDIFGIDYSEESCKAAENLFKLQDNISCDDLSANPFKDKKFDVILSYGVIFLKPVDEMLKDLKIIHGSLKNKGKMIINFRTKDDFLYRDGEKIDDHTYILANPAYKDMCYTFLDKEEVIHLLDQSGFSLLNLSRVDYHKNNLTEHHSWWIAEVIKND